jgi:hypothetical protein
MGYLRCRACGRMLYSNNYQQIGLKCGLNNCSGVFEFVGGYYVSGAKSAKLDLQCKKCLHVCSSAVTGKNIYDRCPIKGCNGTLDRFWG